MKRVIRANSIFEPDYNKNIDFTVSDDDDWYPPLMTEDIVDDILNRIRVKIDEKYGRRFKDLYVEVDDEYWGSKSGVGGSMHSYITVYSGDKKKLEGEFEFATQDSYWDSSDYEQDINVTVNNFVENLV